ncbi:MAG: hypothetical protein ABW203_00945 [Novosphingobium sp.]
MSDIPIIYPARFAPGVAVNYADAYGGAVQVSHAAPLPVVLADGSVAPAAGAVPAPLAGTTAAALVAGPFDPIAGRPIVLSLSGTWTGTVKLLRSTDGGTSKLPLTLAGAPWASFTTNVCEPVWEDAEDSARFYLQLSPTSGTIVYRLAQ